MTGQDIRHAKSFVLEINRARRVRHPAAGYLAFRILALNGAFSVSNRSERIFEGPVGERLYR